MADRPSDDAETPASATPESAPAKPGLLKKAWGESAFSALKSPAGIAAVIAVVVAFGGGLLAGKTLGPHTVSSSGEQVSAWPSFGKPRSAGARRAGESRPDGFAVWKNRVDTSGPEPKACIQMSKPLDASKSYSDYVLISPETGATPAVSVKGDELCVAGLGFTDRRVTLLKGLPGKGSDVLAANADVDFTFGDRPPYVGFAGDGVILPREESDGVGIETVNVAKLDVEVWRIPDRNLVRMSITKTDPSPDGEYMGDWGEDYPGAEGQKVWSGTVPVKGDAGQRTVTVFPLGAVLKEMKPGGYVIHARDASGARGLKKVEGEEDESASRSAQARRWIIFTDMALSTYTGSDGVDVVVRSLKNAKTLSGVKVSLVAANGESLATVSSDASGHARFAKPLLEGKEGMRAKMLMAYGSLGDLAVLDLERSPIDLSQQGIGGRNDPNASTTEGRTANTLVDSYVYADRGIYRPGETVHLIALMRDREAAATNRKGTLVITRPSGTEFKRIAFDKSSGGYVAQDIALPRTAPRGRWAAKVLIEGVDQPAGQMAFSVEDFAPQRLAVDADAQANRPIGAGETRAINLTARFLYGAPGAGLQTQGESRISADPNPFPQFKNYEFGDQQTAFQEKVSETISTITDGAGKAVINISSADAGDTAVPLKAVFTGSVFEPGGRPVRESVFLKLLPKPLYLGVKIDQGDAANGRDAPISLDIIAVDSKGARTAANGVTWTLIAENWNYDWFQQDGRWQWRRTSRDVAVDTGSGPISANGSLHKNRRLGWGDYRLEVVGPSGAKTVIKFAAGWGSSAKDDDAPDLVRVSAGTKTYAQGDTVDLTLKAPYEGEAQIAVATDRVIDFQTIHVGPNGTTVRLKSNAAWGGGAYVMVSVVQPRDPVASPKPRRAMGVAYVSLDPRDRKLSVDIGTPVKLDSKTPVEIPVKVQGLSLGQRARVTVAAVDEGILRLTKFDSPDPVKWYFGKRALNVDYRDDYARLLDANLGAPANVNFGGDELGGEGLTVTPTKTVALWSGVVETGLDGKATVRLPAAAFNGELRLMAVAWTDKSVGSGAKAMTVREAVVADLNLPRFLAPGDRAVGTLELHNLDGKPGGYDASVTGLNGIVVQFKKLVQLLAGQRTTEQMDILAPARQGISKVSMKVAGPGFTTGKDYDLQTRLGWGPETRTFTELQRPGDAFTPTADVMSGLTAGSVTITVSYSPFKGFDPAAVALSLARYPYGCTEQVTSTAYPLLYAAELTTDPKLKGTRSAALSQAVAQLLDRQSLDGAFGMWRAGDGDADGWLGAYATDFLLEAQAQGAAVPQVSIDRALAAMRAISRPDGFGSTSYRMSYPNYWAVTEAASKAATERLKSRASAYALYVLAKGKNGDLARLRWWHDVQMKSEASPVARAQVAAGLALMGDQARARSAMQAAVQALGYKDEHDWYQSTTRDLAAVITYAYEAGQPEVARALTSRLDGSVKSPDLLNTQEQARLMQAAHAMMKAAGPINVEATGAFKMPPTAGGPTWAVGKLEASKFVNKGNGGLWRTVTVQGVPQAAPAAIANGLSVTKTLWTMQGGRIDPGSVKQGDRIIIQLSGVSHQGRAMMLVVDDALPAGFEVETVLGNEDAKGGPFKFLGELSSASVQEKRDDRYIAAMNLEGNKAYSLAYVVRAVTPGDYMLPGAEAKDMYRPQVAARTASSRTVISGQ
jgi:uncharacterized protein YfaS (alpha-2-macroglobulin family)